MGKGNKNILKLKFQENRTIHYPFRTSNYGDWSGLRVEMSSRSDIALSRSINGIQLQIQHPHQWPNSGGILKLN